MRVVGEGGLQYQGGGGTWIWSYSVLCILRMRNVKYCMDVWCGFSFRLEMDGLGTLDCIVGVWMAPLNP